MADADEASKSEEAPMHAAKTYAATKEKDDIIVQAPKSHTNQSYHFVVIEPPTPRIVL